MVMCGHGWWWGRGWGGPSHFTYPLASHTTTHHHHPHPQSPTSPYTTTTTSPHLHTTTTSLYHYHYHHHLLVKPPSATYHHSPTHNTTTHSPPITTAHRTAHIIPPTEYSLIHATAIAATTQATELVRTMSTLRALFEVRPLTTLSSIGPGAQASCGGC